MGASNRQMKPNPPPIGRFHFTVHPLYCIFGGFSDPASPKIYDKFYSERGKTSEWTEQMRKISKTFGTVLINMGRGDWEKAFQSAKDFGSAYQKPRKWFRSGKTCLISKPQKILSQAFDHKIWKKYPNSPPMWEKPVPNAIKNTISVFGLATTGHQHKP